MNVCMLVGTDMSHDARVWKEALTVADAGHVVTVLAAFNPALPAEENTGGVRIIRVAPRAWPFRRPPQKSESLHPPADRPEPGAGQMRRAGASRIFRDWVWGVRARIEVLAWIWRLKPDILHVHDGDRLLLGGLAHALFGCQFIYDAHEYVAGLLVDDTLLAKLTRQWHASLERWLAPRARSVITVNEPIGQLLKTRYGLNDVVLLHNFPPPQPAPPPGHLLRALMPTEWRSRPVLLYQGRLTAHRGIEQFIETLARVEGAVGAIVGSGPLEADLIALAARLGVSARLIFVPQVPWNELPAYTAGADLGFCLSQATCENNRLALPNKLFEYLMAGVPVVMSDYPILRQYVGGENVGAVVEPNSPDRIAAVVTDLLRQPDQLIEMRRNALRVSGMKYNWKVEATKLVALYQRLEQPAGQALVNPHAAKV